MAHPEFHTFFITNWRFFIVQQIPILWLLKLNSLYSGICWRSMAHCFKRILWRRITQDSFSPWIMRAMYKQLVGPNNIKQLYLGNPSILQTTLAARSSNPSSQTVPHLLLWKTSTRPSDGEAPPTRRIGVCVADGAEKRLT